MLPLVALPLWTYWIPIVRMHHSPRRLNAKGHRAHRRPQRVRVARLSLAKNSGQESGLEWRSLNAQPRFKDRV